MRDEQPDLSEELGHLYLGPQSKSRYVSPDFFAMISQEVCPRVAILGVFLLTFQRLQRSISYFNSNSSTLLTPNCMSGGRSMNLAQYKTDFIVRILRVLMIPLGLITRLLQDSCAVIFSPCHHRGRYKTA